MPVKPLTDQGFSTGCPLEPLTDQGFPTGCPSNL